MNKDDRSRLMCAAVAAGIAFGFTSCSVVTHVPPGQSVAFAKAPKADFVAEPQVAVAEPVHSWDVPYYGPAVEPELPAADFSLPDELAQVDDAVSYFEQGSAYLDQGKSREAVNALTKAVELEPGLSAAWQNLARAYEDLGEADNATEALRKAGKPEVTVETR